MRINNRGKQTASRIQVTAILNPKKQNKQTKKQSMQPTTMAAKIHQHLFLFSFISLFFTINATLLLHPSDHNALTTLQNNLGVNVNGNSNGNATTNQPCNADGVFCERRLLNNETYVLRITKLIFNSKNLKGKLSPLIGKLTELNELSLSHNKIVDRIPTSIVDCRKLEILNLSNNLFSGEVPSEFSSLIRLRVLDISSNNLAGNLNFLRYFPNLETISIASNLFTDRIPSSFRSFRNLRHFNFTGNRFLESSVSLLQLQNTDTTLNPNHKRHILVENHAPASAPSSSHRKKSSNSSVSASASAPGPSAKVHGHKHKKSKRKLVGWIVGFIAGAFAGTLSGFVFSLLFKVTLALIKGKGKGSGPAIYSPLIKRAEDLAFLEKEDGLASMEIIGRGGCGEVYKAELPGSNGKMIAIKKVIQPSKDAVELAADEDSKLLHKKMRQIKSEINTVGQIRHRNLLPLLAHLSRPDCHYLVYEFMKNGSLQDMLHRVEKGEAELDWLTRHKIAVGVAAGLEYLHMNHSPRIIHRDLKPANILLDDDMEARIADFGLAKAMPEAQTHVTTSNVAGTVGYIAPEYHQILKFTDKCDIYSFGVMLGVLVIGKQPSDEFFQHTDEMSLVKWMKNVITSETPKIAIDSRLMGNGYEEQMLLVLKIACFCTMDDPKERPNSKDVRCMLSQIKHNE